MRIRQRVHARFPPSPLQVWAVESDSVQVVWGQLPAGRVGLSVAGRTVSIDHVGGAGSIVADGLPASSALEAEVSWHDEHDRTKPRHASLSFRTLATPPGELLAKVATISDLHLGARYWGFLKTMEESKLLLPPDLEPPLQPHPIRCARAAVEEALGWGATNLIVKGDAAHHRTKSDFALVDDLLDQICGAGPNRFAPGSILAIPGNHDVDNKSEMPLPATFGRQNPVSITRTQAYLDIPGIRLIVGDTTIDGEGPGTLDRCGSGILELAADTKLPVLVATHHHFQSRSYPTYWPMGIPAPQSTDFLHDLRQANPRSVVTSGHTHRNRARDHGPVLVTQVASTRDWPGVWAGYRIHEGGMSQVVRRIARPGAIHWHEYSKDAVLGSWRFWAQGPLGQRCLTWSWDDRTAG